LKGRNALSRGPTIEHVGRQCPADGGERLVGVTSIARKALSLLDIAR
jgi:hypothetical protein